MNLSSFKSRVHFVRLTVIRGTLSGDALSLNDIVETDLGYRWCRIEPVQGADDLKTHVISTRSRPDPCKPGDIADYKGVRYVVLALRGDPETGVTYLDCRSDES